MSLSFPSEQPELVLPWRPFFASLIAGTCAAWLVSPSPHAPPHSLASASLRAVLLVPLVAAVSAAVARIGFPAFSTCPDHQAPRLARSCGALAAWLLPATVLVAQRRLWAIPLALFLGVAAARLLRRCAFAINEPRLQPDRAPARLFSTLHLALPASVSLQTALVALLTGQLAPAALLAGAGSFFIAFSASSAERSFSPLRGRRRALLQTAAACLLACLALIRIPGPAGGRFRGIEQGESAPAGHGQTSRDLLSGAILLADPSPFARLVAPVPRSSGGRPALRLSDPIVIEFTGVYWILTVPHTRPPRSSFVVRDSPLTYSFTTPDRTPLVMQAHQQLPFPINPRCCSALEVVARNDDPQPGTIALHAFLTVSGPPKAPRLSLGARPLSPGGTALLRFPIPPRPALPAFDRIILNFQLAGRRQHRSAKVSILRFALIPRPR